jgi:diguanylate cyclase (GGDEF)-like protein
MNDNQKLYAPAIVPAAGSLTKVLDQSAHIKDVVEKCAQELSTVNSVLKHELVGLDTLPAVEIALEQSETVESRVQVAAEELEAVNQALETEVREREMLEHQLAAVKEQEEAARHAAFHDPLTGLPNRVLFNDRLEHGLAQARRHGWKIAVMFVDLDDFKSINDAYGHDVGDIVLQTIARRLRENTREDDTVCRHGGDEFLYLLMEIRDERDAIKIAEKIIEVIQEPCDIRVRDLAISPSIGASIGIALYPTNATTADALIKNADKAMYRAKRIRSGYAFAR